MRILITGGAGFIGSALCRYLIHQTENEVINVDKLTYASNLVSLEQIENDSRYFFERTDICDLRKIREVIDHYRPHAIAHLAAESHVDRSIAKAGTFIQSNVVGTYNLLEATRSYWENLPPTEQINFRFLHVSTDEVYGSLGESGLFTEETAYDPSSPYSASKASSDHLVTAWHRTYGLPILISNCSNNYGPFQFPEKLIPLMCINALRGDPLPVYGNGLNVRDWLHVEDHVKALYTILQKGKPGEKYNVGGDSERTNLQIVRIICDHLDKVRPTDLRYMELIRMVDDRPGHDFRYAIDASKIKSQLGWSPHQRFEEGLASTIDWYIENPQWWRPLVERGRKLFDKSSEMSDT